MDGKTDKFTCLMKDVTVPSGEKKKKRVIELEHHLVFTQESRSNKGEYLTRCVVSQNAKGTDLGRATAKVIRDFESENSIKAILLDNTAINSGHKTGLVVSLEEELGKDTGGLKNLHLIGSALHQNELSFQYVFDSINRTERRSQTNFPGGVLGNLLHEHFETTPKADFETISSRLSTMKIDDKVKEDLSLDQRLLLEYVRGIATGQVEPKYAAWRIGPVGSARWLTLSIRCCSLYVRNAYPDSFHQQMHE